MKIIIFNGPAGCGKDEAVGYLNRQYNAYPFSFKSRLKKITLEIYGVSEPLWDSWYTREGKELPREELDGKSCRQALIHVSEDIIKPNFGKDYFGKVEARRINSMFHAEEGSVVACSDGGFNEEVVPFVEMFGEENVHIVQIQRDGCSFKGDSRNWIDSEAILEENYWVLHNNSTLVDFWKKLDLVYHSILEQ